MNAADSGIVGMPSGLVDGVALLSSSAKWIATGCAWAEHAVVVAHHVLLAAVRQ